MNLSPIEKSIVPPGCLQKGESCQDHLRWDPRGQDPLPNQQSSPAPAVHCLHCCLHLPMLGIILSPSCLALSLHPAAEAALPCRPCWQWYWSSSLPSCIPLLLLNRSPAAAFDKESTKQGHTEQSMGRKSIAPSL